ncbi:MULTISPECIES: DUF6047 family protein [Bacteroides]|uniref:DUF6047 family protein n=1 Tax=Bacteroides TaxID=816 RepID=UPI00319E34A7
MCNEVPLRGLEFIYAGHEEKYLPLLVMSGLVNYLHAQPEVRLFAQTQDTFHDDPSQTLTAVETAKGVLLFEYSGYGRECLRAYTQHIANHFFTPDGQAHQYIHLYKLSHPEKEVLQTFQNASNAFSVYTGFFLPDKIQYLDASILRGARQDKSHRIEPTFDAFRQFTSSYELTTNMENAQVLRLLSLKETGGIYGMEHSTRYIPFMYKNSFNSLLDTLKNTPAENWSEQNRIKAAIGEKADYILKRDYELFSSGIRQKEVEPAISLQTPKGAVYLPATDEGAIYKQCYLQYLADRFFTPEVQTLGRIREFYISCPNHSTEHYMQKHLELFRTNPFYGQLAKMPLYPIEQSELLKKGGYPIEPTYHAFKQFTEDYRLSVTPENAEIFTLLFIREYGLPADFNTNESYKEFTHKGDFKPLDQEMSELQSKKGYSEKTFYNIQNRQQQLADKILGLEYKLACPPLQLTGPAASEKRKTAPRQNKSHNPRI